MTNQLLVEALKQIQAAALQAVDPEVAVNRFLASGTFDLRPFQRVYAVGMGKAAVPMARALENALGGQLRDGLVVVKDGHGGSLCRVRVREASHPEPDDRGMAAALEMVGFLEAALTPNDLLVVLISGGGSALLPLPVEGITLEDKKRTTAILTRCGANIHEINAIRKHLSRTKGGRLLDYVRGCSVLSLILSDVVGDDFATIASGPTSPDPSTYRECAEIVEKYELGPELPPAVLNLLSGPDHAGHPETPKPGDERFERTHNILVGSNLQALQAAAAESERLGFTPLILSSSITGSTAEAARFHTAVAREVLKSGHPVAAPCCLISGGETTVQVRGSGRGGRNTEFALWCASEIANWGPADILFASIATDGTDGPTDAAGAFVTPETARKARLKGLSSEGFLSNNDSYTFFDRIGDLIVTGPTRTNVMDIHLVLVGKLNQGQFDLRSL